MRRISNGAPGVLELARERGRESRVDDVNRSAVAVGYDGAAALAWQSERRCEAGGKRGGRTAAATSNARAGAWPAAL